MHYCSNEFIKSNGVKKLENLNGIYSENLNIYKIIPLDVIIFFITIHFIYKKYC